MVTIEELKLGNKTLEALKFLLLQINELDVILNELNFEELREANNQAKTQIEVLNNIKILVLNTEKSIEQAKALIDSRSDEVNTTKREIEDAKTNIIKAKDDTILIYENISSKSERIEQKYNDIAGIKKEVDKKFDDIKNIEDQSRDIANEITNNKNITLKKIDENVNTLNNTISNINILKNETLQEIATTKASIDTKANEALSQASTALTDIRGIIADFRGKQTELNALKASLEILKSSLENLNKSGLINDTQSGIAQTYSSNKINNLLQGVLRESDAAEGNTAGKLVKRNAQGNIYATNVYLNATTKAEVSDIKNSLSTDKWRFIVRDTGEGLLRSMSIKDFISSQEVDAYTKSESDDKYLAKSEASTDNVSNTLVKRGTDKNISVNNIKISDTGSDIEMVRDIERDTQSPYQLLIRKSKDEPIKLMNLQNFIGRLNYYSFNNTQERIEKSYWYIPDRWQSSVRGEYDYIRAKTEEYLCLNSLKLLGKNYKGTDPTPKATGFWNSQNTSFAVLTKDGEYDVLGKCSLATLDDRIKEKATKAVQDSGSFIQEKVNSAIVEKQTVKKLRNGEIDLKQAVNFIVELTSATYDVISALSLTEKIIGQSGVIVIKGARNIREWKSFIKWREIPTDLKETEVFAYFVASANEVYMGRA
ncbi:hypothetical protein [Campylobacter concisus]|uniref:hypothetical protein n=1 Tax=Campylobacter concisus TaxID=199 RepID=UPI000CD8209E|nr:hypothetical protein [Campylobacter concisus]